MQPPTWNRATSSSAATLIHSMHCTAATSDSATLRRWRRAPSRCHHRPAPLPLPLRSQPSGLALLPPTPGDSGLPPGAEAVAVTTTDTVPLGGTPLLPALPAGGTATSSSASRPAATSAQASRKAGVLRWCGYSSVLSSMKSGAPSDRTTAYSGV